MKRLFRASVVALLLVVMPSVACAASTVKSSKSNSSDRIAVHDTVMTPSEAAAFLAQWDRIPVGATNEAAVQGILKQVLGPRAANVRKIVIQAGSKPPRVIVLANPMLEAEAVTFGREAPASAPAPGNSGKAMPPTGAGTAFPAPPAGLAVTDEGSPAAAAPKKPPAR